MTFKQEHVSCIRGCRSTAFMWSYEATTSCPACGASAERDIVALPNRAPAVHPDDIPGGMDIKNAICHADGSPKRFYSKSAIRAEARAKGWTIAGETPKDPGSRWV